MAGSNGSAHAAFGLHLGERTLELRAPLVPAERLHQELHPVLVLVLVVAEAVEHAHDRLGDVQHLLDRQELVQHADR